MALKPPVPIPTPGGVFFKPPQRPVAGAANSAVQAYQAPASGGGSSTSGWSSGGSSSGDEIISPWEKALKQNYAEASAPTPYQGEWKQGVSQAMSLGNRDYEGALRGFAQEDVNKQIQSQDNQLGAIGMRELGLRADVQTDRGKLRTDASTRAMIDSQGIKANALASMQSMLTAASGAELQRIASMISAANSGSSQYNEFQRMAIPIQEKLAAAKQALIDKNDATRRAQGVIA